jgi:hypothetical protein
MNPDRRPLILRKETSRMHRPAPCPTLLLHDDASGVLATAGEQPTSCDRQPGRPEDRLSAIRRRGT